jgi:hypothetical protein
MSETLSGSLLAVASEPQIILLVGEARMARRGRPLLSLPRPRCNRGRLPSRERATSRVLWHRPSSEMSGDATAAHPPNSPARRCRINLERFDCAGKLR